MRKSDFPILQKSYHERPLVYLDNAATTQLPKPVIDRLSDYFCCENSNIHRGVYDLSQNATTAYEAVRGQVANFIGAQSPETIVFTSGTTASLNLIADSYGPQVVAAGDTIVVTAYEHHSNLLPWQRLAKQQGAELLVIALNADGTLDMQDAQRKITAKTQILALPYVSNVLGNVLPVAELTAYARQYTTTIVIDGAQAVPHLPVNVTEIDCDFLAFSGHKMLAPMGVGVLYGKKSCLASMPPTVLGGGIVTWVTEQSSSFQEAPWKFEAGTPNVSGVLALGAAVTYLETIGMTTIADYEQQWVQKLRTALAKIAGVTVYYTGPVSTMTSIVSLTLAGVHPHDLATFLDQQGIATRAGFHCAQPLMMQLNTAATLRISAYFYNTDDDILAVITAIQAAKEYFTHDN